MSATQPGSMMIGQLAEAAGVGVETVRYYHRRGLLPLPAAIGARRRYPGSAADRIRFIKRAQELGFSLNEVTELLQLEDGTDRKSIRQIAADRLQQIESKVADLQRMQQALQHLVTRCEQTRANRPCPIIATLATKVGA